MQALLESFQKQNQTKNIFIHSYCVMDNHYHQSTSYKESSSYLSQHMRYTHGLFGSRYNKIHKRSGKVAEARPKTSLIENTEHEIRVHFYIEANPVRAGLCKPENLRSYKFNSFKFYAYGIRDEYTSLLTIPEWYLQLGRTMLERQKKYRKLFYSYLFEQEGYEINPQIYECAFIGSQLWQLKQKELVIDLLRKKDTG